MIKVTTLDHREIALNPDLLAQAESIPETVLTMTNGKKILVCESINEIVDKFILYKQRIYSESPIIWGKERENEKV